MVQRNALIQRCESLRNRLVLLVPWTKPILGTLDMRLLLIQMIGTLIPIIIINYLFLLSGNTLREYTVIMIIRFPMGMFSMFFSFIGIQHWTNDKWSGKIDELFRTSMRFTVIEGTTYLPIRLVSFAFESFFVGGFGLSRFIAGNVILPLFAAFHGLVNNRIGKKLYEGKTVAQAITEGVANIPRDLSLLVRLFHYMIISFFQEKEHPSIRKSDAHGGK